jgi:TPR repeat protein
MRKQDIRLITRARHGDATARCEVGRRYLLGIEGFQRHVATGLDYLSHASLAGQTRPARLIAEALALEELVSLDQTVMLARAAEAGCIPAQVKLGAWCIAGGASLAQGQHWLAASAQAGHAGALAAGEALAKAPGEDRMLRVLSALTLSGDLDGAAVARLAAGQALAACALDHLAVCLRVALALSPSLDVELVALLTAAVGLAEANGHRLEGLPGEALRQSLEQCAVQADRDAAFTLGRGLCGLACEALPPAVFAEHQNTRKGAAFLLRAADAGCDAAWLQLYRLHANHSLSVANPQMARFFLEKAAQSGQREAQRKLGALGLRESSSLAHTEQAIAWLYQAAEQGDQHAATLLGSLVLPVEGSDVEAAFTVEQVRQSDPWLAQRLALARAFGLTKLEGLSVDPSEGIRPWGLVVGKNPFIVQVRLAAARAVPATSALALASAQQAAVFFARSHGVSGSVEGDLRARSMRQRRIFERLGIDEALFFADASSMTLDTLRKGAKWAFKSRRPLHLALAN